MWPRLFFFLFHAGFERDSVKSEMTEIRANAESHRLGSNLGESIKGRISSDDNFRVYSRVTRKQREYIIRNFDRPKRD